MKYKLGGYLSKITNIIVLVYNQRKNVSLQSDCYPRQEEAIRLIRRKEFGDLNHRQIMATRLKLPGLLPHFTIKEKMSRFNRIATHAKKSQSD